MTIGSRFSANGASEYLQVDIPAVSPPYSLFAWAWMTNFSGSRLFFGVQDPASVNTASSLLMGYSTTQLRTVVVNDAGTSTNLANTAITPASGVWYFMVHVENGSADRWLVVNGDIANKVSNTTSRVITNATRLSIGARRNSGSNYNTHHGHVQHCGLVRRALSDAEIIALYQGMDPLLLGPSLANYFPSLGVFQNAAVDLRDPDRISGADLVPNATVFPPLAHSAML